MSEQLNLPWTYRQIGTGGAHNEFALCEILDSAGMTITDPVFEQFAKVIVESVNEHNAAKATT